MILKNYALAEGGDLKGDIVGNLPTVIVSSGNCGGQIYVCMGSDFVGLM